MTLVYQEGFENIQSSVSRITV